MKKDEANNQFIIKINDNEILVFDEVGDLINLYAAGDLAIVAGSINYAKGHNFMEPIFADTLSITGSKLSDNIIDGKNIWPLLSLSLIHI